MPDAPDKTTAPASDKQPVNPDMVGEELADNANIWHVYDRIAKEDDERRTKSWDNGLNNLALFAGLFSAVTTAFIIEARQDMEPDYAQLTFLVLNATAFGEKPVHKPFVIPSGARTVNCLWIASLILSLSAALIAIMGKDWIGMYTARPVCNLRQWAEMRTYRLLCVERWYMPGVIAAAPVLLHISLLLFGAGLVLFISSDSFTHHLTLGLSLAAGALYLVTTLSAIVFSASPFKSPATQIIRAAFSAFSSYALSATIRPKRDLVGTLLRDVNLMVVGRADESAFVQVSVADARPRPGLTGRAALLSRLRHYIYPPGRNAIPSLARETNATVVGCVDGFALLPDSSPYIRQRHSLRSMAAAVTAAGKALVSSLQSLPSSLHTAYQNMRWSRVRLQLHLLVSSIRRIPFNDWFLSSLWTDLPADRRPQLLADALSWLNAASQAPDVFRAIIFALGDLDVGPQVGKHTTTALHTRLRAEIRRTWRQVDFLMLSRYVLADQNTLGDPVLVNHQFEGRFELSKDSARTCEEGLAAFIRVGPGYISPGIFVQYSPHRVTQTRMHELLLPHMRKSRYRLTDRLIVLTSRYRAHLWKSNSFNLSNLEAHLYETLDPERRNAYATAVTVNYGGTPGAIELLTFLCFQPHSVLDDVTKPAAVELVMHLLGRESPVRDHRCLAYLFGESDLWDATWKDKRWSFDSLYRLSRSLHPSLSHPREPRSWFDLALARTAVMLLSPQSRSLFPFGQDWIEFLHGRLCQTPSLDNDKVIRLVLRSAALLRIVGMREDYDGRHTSEDIAILAAIISHVGHRLFAPSTIHDGEELFAALARTEGKWPDGEICIWDLGDWLRTTAPESLRQHPSTSGGMQDIHDTLSAIYPLCEHNPELRAIWDRIGYPGRPGDIFSYPFLDLGAFFASAEEQKGIHRASPRMMRPMRRRA